MWFGRRSASMAVALTALTGGVALASPSVIGEASPPQVVQARQSQCTTTAADEDVASEIAARCGHDVEIPSKRTEWNTVYAQADGTMRFEASIAAVRTRVSGQWQGIDRSLVATESGIEVASPVVEMTFSDGTPGMPLARVERDGKWLTFDTEFDLPSPTITSESQLTYFDIIPGVDLVVSINEDATGFGNVLRVASPRAGSDPRLAELTFPVVTSTDLRLDAANGGVEALAGDGSRVFSSPPPAMWDSRLPVLSFHDLDTFRVWQSEDARAKDGVGRDARAEGRRGGERLSELTTVLRPDELRVAVDQAMLEDPSTVWPVYIDPPVTGSLSSYVAVSTAGWNKYNLWWDEGMGRCNSTSMGCSTPLFTERLAYQFVGLQGIAGATVTSATLGVLGTHSYSCTQTWTEAWWTGAISSGTTWNTLGWIQGLDSRLSAPRAGCGTVGRDEFNVAYAAQQAVSQGSSQLTLGLKAANESTMSAGWKRYRWDASLSVVYDRPPSLPTGLSVSASGPGGTCAAGPVYTRTTTPTLTASVSDLDGDKVGLQIYLYDVTTGTANRVWLSAVSPWQAQGAVSLTVPAGLVVAGHTYTWHALPFDEPGAYGPYAGCTFVVDTTAPPPPTVSGQRYQENLASGGIGVADTFTISGAPSDFFSYTYSFDKGGSGTKTTTPATVAFPAASAGRDVLHVTVSDKAGWTATKDYAILVDFPGLVGVWTFDEGQETTANALGVSALSLTLSGTGVSWSEGPLGQRAGMPTDWALTTAGGTASTTAEVLPAVGSFTVMATVKLTQAATVATAVSEDSTNASSFQLGYRQGSSCPGGTGACWAFSRATSDSASPAESVASLAGASTGSWVHLTGVYDASGSGRIRLYACQVATSTATVAQAPTATAWVVPASGSFIASSSLGLVVGRGEAAGAAANPWSGAVADVRVYNGVVDEAMVRSACQNPR